MKVIKNDVLLKSYIKKWRLENALNSKIEYLQLHEFKEGEMVFFSGDELNYIYIIVSGKLRIFPISSTGKEILLCLGEPLDIMGDIEYITKEKINNNVMALKDTMLIGIPKRNMAKVLDKNEEMYRFMLDTMARKLKFSGKRYYTYLLSPLKNRLAQYLYEISDKGKINKLKVNYKNIAEFLGVSPRHLRRVLEELEEENLISREGKCITVSSDILNLVDEI